MRITMTGSIEAYFWDTPWNTLLYLPTIGLTKSRTFAPHLSDIIISPITTPWSTAVTYRIKSRDFQDSLHLSNYLSTHLFPFRDLQLSPYGPKHPPNINYTPIHLYTYPPITYPPN